MDNDIDIIIITVAIAVVTFILEYLDDEDDTNARGLLEKVDGYVENIIPRLNNQQFKEHFRMQPSTFEILLQYLHNSCDELHEINRGQPECSLEKQTLITIWYLSNLECFRSVADRFGISKSSCWRILYRMCNRLLKVNSKYKIICFPTEEKAVQIINDFESINGFPGVIGCIDGCHIRIEKPNDHPNSYINRKGYPSILLQGICDKNKLFLDVYTGEPGSLHDYRLFTKSDIGQRILNGEVVFPNDSHLVGDLAYKLSTKVMVGFKDNGFLTEPQKYFNYKLSQIRISIENAFGILKSRFRRLKLVEAKRIDLISLLTVSACILHNLCLLRKDFLDEVITEDFDNHPNEDIWNYVDGPESINKRNNIVNYLYTNRNQ